MPHEIDITIKVDDDFLSDIMWTAFDGQYGGCNDWASADDYKIERPADCGDSCVDSKLVSVIVKDAEALRPEAADFEPQKVDHAVLVRGIERILTKHVKVGDSILGYVRTGVLEQDAGEIDSIAADCIVQAGLFNDIIYG